MNKLNIVVLGSCIAAAGTILINEVGLPGWVLGISGVIVAFYGISSGRISLK